MDSSTSTAPAGGSGPLGFGAALQVISAPRAAFEAVARDPQWIGPTLISLVIAVVGAFLMLPVGLSMQEELTIASLEKFDAPDEVVDQALAELPDPDNPGPGFYGQQMSGPIIATVFGLLLGALIVMLGAKFAGGGEGYRANLSLVAVANVIASLGFLVKAAVTAMTGTYEVSLGLPALLGLEFHSLPAIFLDLLDPFFLWHLFVLGIGVSVVNRVSKGAGNGVAFVWWALSLLRVRGMRFYFAWILGPA